MIYIAFFFRLRRMVEMIMKSNGKFLPAVVLSLTNLGWRGQYTLPRNVKIPPLKHHLITALPKDSNPAGEIKRKLIYSLRYTSICDSVIALIRTLSFRTPCREKCVNFSTLPCFHISQLVHFSASLAVLSTSLWKLVLRFPPSADQGCGSLLKTWLPTMVTSFV